MTPPLPASPPGTTGASPAAGATPEALAARVKAAGRHLGFDRVAIGPADPATDGAAFEAWLDAGYAGTMQYLARGRVRRLDPREVLPGVRAVVACALNYHQAGPGGYGSDLAGGDAGPGHVARYAWGDDYHAVVGTRLRLLVGEIALAVPGTTSRAYVDTGPVLERSLAARAGLGWVGKNTMLLDPTLGSFFFIGVVLTTAALAFDAPLPDRCGTCTRCLDACPTDAFVAPHVLDARRCIAYLTIEHRGPIPAALRPALGGRAFGCDVCQDVCPWNRRVPSTAEPAFLAGAVPGLVDLARLSEEEYRARRLSRSPLGRARRRGLARNAVVALGNVGGPGAREALGAALADPEPEVRAHAAWALGRLGGERAAARLRSARAGEAEPGVVEEIEAALEVAAREERP